MPPDVWAAFLFWLMATVATRNGCNQALTLKFRLLSIRFASMRLPEIGR
jgi:hypothetical protein